MKRTATVASILKKTIFGLVIVFAFGIFSSAKAEAATYTVTSTADAGAGSFRQAVADANSNAGADVINFNIAGTGPHTITLTSGGLGGLTGPTVINGLSQSGSVCNGTSTDIKIRIDLNGNVNPLWIDSGATGSEINGLALANTGPNSYALAVIGDNSTVRCNYFGTFDGATTASTNINSDYVTVLGDGITIGGSNATDQNLFIGSSNAYINASSTNPNSTVTIKNNVLGTDLAGTTAIATSASQGINIGAQYSSVVIESNYIAVAGNGYGIFFGSPASVGTSNISILSNYLGVNRAGTSAFAGTSSGVYFQSGGYSIIDISGNLIATTNYSSLGAIQMNGAGSFDYVDITNNKINVDVTGLNSFAGSGGVAVNGATGSYWNIEGNAIYNSVGYGIDYSGISNSSITNNTIGLDSTLSCLAAQATGVRVAGSDSQDNVFGGTGVTDGNTICTSNGYRGILFEGDVSKNNSFLGNKIVSGLEALAHNGTNDLNTPNIYDVTVNGSNTDITYSYDIPAGNYRVEFFNSSVYANANGNPQAEEYLSSVNISSAGTGAQQTTSTISGNTHDFITISITEIDGSSDGFGATSQLGTLVYDSDLEFSTTDGYDIVEELKNNHVVTQTITNLSGSSVDYMKFTMFTQTCLTINSVTTSGSATDAGAYVGSPDFEWSGQLDVGQTLILSFDVDVTCSAGDVMVFDHRLAVARNNDYLVNDQTADNDDTIDTNTITVPSTNLTIDTTDGMNSIQFGTTGHTITQTISNLGPASVTDIEFQQDQLDCLSINSVATSGTATNAGVYTGSPDYSWSGELGAGQNLILTFSVDVTCMTTDTAGFTHTIINIERSGESITDMNLGDNDYTDSTDVTGPITDLSVTKTLLNQEDIAVGGVLNYQLTLTNVGPQSIDLTAYNMGGGNPLASALFLDIMPPELEFIDSSSTNSDVMCQLIGPASLAGLLLESVSDHNIIACAYIAPSGTLGAGESISTTISVTVAEGSDLAFKNILISGLAENDPDFVVMESVYGGEGGCEPGSDLVVCYRDNGINNFFETPYVADTSLTKTLVNPESVYVGGTASFDIGLANAGPMPFSTGFYDGVEGNILFADIYPGNLLTYTGTDSEGIECIDLGPGSASLLGAFASEHTAYNLVICGATDPDEELAVGASKSYRLNFSVNGDFESSTNYAMMTTPYTYDLDILSLNQEMFGAEGDVLDALDNPNFAKVAFSQVSSPGGGDSGGTGSSGAGGVASTGDRIVLLVALGLTLIVASVIIWKKTAKSK